MKQQLKINAVAHLILDHLSSIRDYFESQIDNTNDAEMAINMFYAIDDFASEIYHIIEKYKYLDEWQEYRSKLRIALSIDKLFTPITKEGIDELELRQKTARKNLEIHLEVMKKLKSDPSGRWSQVCSLRRELNLFNLYHVPNDSEE